MGITNGVGISDYTQTKQNHFREIINTHIKIVKCIFYKKENGWINKKYFYFDINAGPGEYNGINGSPQIFLDTARINNISYRALLIELEINNYFELFKKYNNRFCVKIIHGDHNNILPQHLQYGRNIYGLLYHDPTGKIPSFNLLAQFSSHYPMIDLLINCSCTNIKRVRKATNDHNDLLNSLAIIDKKFWLIREPYGAYQFTFLIGTNWTKFPEFKNIGLHRIDSDNGKKIIKTLNYTKEELNENQQN